MSNKKKIFRDTKKIEDIPKSRKPYRKPRLQELGDLRTLTLGGSPGVGDSGAGWAVEDPFSGFGPLPPPGG